MYNSESGRFGCISCPRWFKTGAEWAQHYEMKTITHGLPWHRLVIQDGGGVHLHDRELVLCREFVSPMDLHTDHSLVNSSSKRMKRLVNNAMHKLFNYKYHP
jgi:hypothetical protein